MQTRGRLCKVTQWQARGIQVLQLQRAHTDEMACSLHSGETLQGAVSQKLEAATKQAPQGACSAPLPEDVPIARQSSLQSVGTCTPLRPSTLSRGTRGCTHNLQSDYKLRAGILLSSVGYSVLGNFDDLIVTGSVVRCLWSWTVILSFGPWVPC